MKTGNEMICGGYAQEVDPVRGICGAHGEYETAEGRHIRRTDGGRGLRGGGQEKEWIGCFLNDLRTFSISADQWTTAAQDGGE